MQYKQNAMQQPNAPLDDALAGSRTQQIPVPDETRIHWQELPMWARILAVTNFAGAAMTLIGFFTLFPILRKIPFLDVVTSNNISLVLLIALLFVLVLNTLIGWSLWRYGDSLKNALLFDDGDQLDLSFYYLRNYFRTLGWMTIAYMVLSVLFVAVIFYSMSR